MMTVLPVILLFWSERVCACVRTCVRWNLIFNWTSFCWCRWLLCHVSEPKLLLVFLQSMWHKIIFKYTNLLNFL
jgi:hypothetical protein